MPEIELLPTTQLLRRVAMEDGWFADHPGNAVMGWGKDVEGQIKATEWFQGASENGMLGIYADAPVGWLTVHKDGERAARLKVFVAPEKRSNGIGTEAVRLVLEEFFSKGLYRISAKVLDANGPARRFFQKRCGFIQEGKRWSDAWVDGQPHDTISLVITRPLYRKRQKEKVSNGTS